MQVFPRCLEELRQHTRKSISEQQSEPHLPLRLEKLQQHGICVEPLCNCLCNLGGREGPERGWHSRERLDMCLLNLGLIIYISTECDLHG